MPDEITLYAHQVRMLESRARVVALVGGTGSGKTWSAPMWVYDRACEKPGGRMLAIGLGYQKHVQRVMMYELKRYLDSIECEYRLAEGKGVLSFPNGFQVLFGSMENPESLEGAHVNAGAWLDEAGLMPKLAWEVADRRTAFGGGQILITTVPYVEGWLKRDIADRAGTKWVTGVEEKREGLIPGDQGGRSYTQDIEWIQCRTADNLAYPKELIEEKRKAWRPEKFAVFYLGEFSKAYGQIYPQPPDEELIIEDFIVPADWPLFAGHDYGFNAPTTGMFGRLDVEGEMGTKDCLYLVAEYEKREASIRDHIDNWTEMGATELIDGAFGDPANPGVWQDASDHGYAVVPANNAILAGIDAVYDRLLSGRLRVFRSCEQFIEHRKTYRWAPNVKNDDQLIDKPLKPQEAEHMMDALRYLVMGIAEYGFAPSVPTVGTHGRTMGNNW